jgi:phage terminase large subunit-like protein
MLEQTRRMIGEQRPRHFVLGVAGQYQRMPSPLGGDLVKLAWFRQYTPSSELPESFDRIVQSWDTANKATELSDFSVCTT